jgi:hypothetical protein
MVGKPGPFQIISSSDQKGCVDSPIAAPRRRYLCQNYATCLDLAAALNWDNFTCRGCSGEIDAALLWRARTEIRKDRVVSKLCTNIPEIAQHSSNSNETERPAFIPLRLAK